MATPVPNDKKVYIVVVADEYQVIFYTRDSRSGPLTQVRTVTNEAARMKTGDLIADRGGRSFDSHGQGRHTMTSEKHSPKEQVARTFAKQIAQLIAAETHKGRSRGFALIAAPRFLGLLRREIGTHTKVEPYVTVDKEVVGQDVSVIEKLLAQHQ